MIFTINCVKADRPEPEEYFARPRTEPTQRRDSSQNAIKHGIFAQNPLIGDEKKEDWEAFLKDYNNDHKPFGATEEGLVLRLAHNEWRSRRIPQLEAKAVEKALDTGDVECKGLNLFSIYSNRLSREFQAMLKTLKTLQAERLKEEGRNFRIAVIMWEYFKSKGVNWNPQEDGFVFSQEWLDKQLTLNDYMAAAFHDPPFRVTTKEMDQLLVKMAAYHSQYAK